MIVIKIDMWPQGDKSRAYRLGRATISNIGGDESTGEYEAVIAGKLDGPTKITHVRDFPRLRLDVWHLLRRVLEKSHAR